MSFGFAFWRQIALIARAPPTHLMHSRSLWWAVGTSFACVQCCIFVQRHHAPNQHTHQLSFSPRWRRYAVCAAWVCRDRISFLLQEHQTGRWLAAARCEEEGCTANAVVGILALGIAPSERQVPTQRPPAISLTTVAPASAVLFEACFG